jgi:hypothetical protein
MPIGSSWAPQLARYYLGRKEFPVVKKFAKEVNFARYVDDCGVLGQVDPQVIRKFKSEYERAIAPLRVKWDHAGAVISLRILNGRVGGRFGEPRWIDRGRRPGPVLVMNDMVEYWASRVREVLSVAGAWDRWRDRYERELDVAKAGGNWGLKPSGTELERDRALSALLAIEQRVRRPTKMARALEALPNTATGIGSKIVGTEQSVTWGHNVARICALSVEHGCRWIDVMRKVGRGIGREIDKKRVKIEGPWWYGEVGQGYGAMRKLVRKAVVNILERKRVASGEKGSEISPSMIAVVVRPVGVFSVQREALRIRY